MTTQTHSGAQSGVRPADSVVAPWVLGMKTGIVNLAFVGEEGAGDRGWTLVDTGFTGYAASILKRAEERFGEGARPSAIVLTHGHFDHVGNLHRLLQAWPETPVFAHHMEMPYLDGRSKYPPPDPTVGGGMMARMSPLFPGGPFDFRPHLRELPADGTVPTLPDWEWVATPGHSPGHVSLFRREDGVLLAGDAFVTTKQESVISAVSQSVHVQGPPWYYTPDFAAARTSVENLRKLMPSVALTGHGPVVEGETLLKALSEILRDWDQRGITPAKGRYWNQPAAVDEWGVVSLPPKPVDWVGIGMAVGTGLLALGALGLLFRRDEK